MHLLSRRGISSAIPGKERPNSLSFVTISATESVSEQYARSTLCLEYPGISSIDVLSLSSVDMGKAARPAQKSQILHRIAGCECLSSLEYRILQLIELMSRPMRQLLCFGIVLVLTFLGACTLTSVSPRLGEGRAYCESRDGRKCRGTVSCSATPTSCTACSMVDGELHCESKPPESGY